MFFKITNPELGTEREEDVGKKEHQINLKADDNFVDLLSEVQRKLDTSTSELLRSSFLFSFKFFLDDPLMFKIVSMRKIDRQ